MSIELTEYRRPLPELAAASAFAKAFRLSPGIPAFSAAYKACRGSIESEAWARQAAKERAIDIESLAHKGRMLRDFLNDIAEESVTGIASTGRVVALSILRDVVMLADE